MRSFVSSFAAASGLALLMTSPPAAAYGPYTHAYVAARAAKQLGLDATRTRYYVAGALLADIDKANRLKQMFKVDAIVRMLQGCTGTGPIARGATHDAAAPLVAKLVAHADARARALGLGMRNHGSTDRYADTTMPSRLGHANSGSEDLAFDVAHARTSIPGAASALALGVTLLEDAAVRGWIAGAAGLGNAAVKTQMRGYACFVKGYVRDKAKVMGALLKTAIIAGWLKECVAANGIKSVTRCTPSKMGARWAKMMEENTKVANEAVGAAVTDYKSVVK